MKILITGAKGFIGKELINRLKNHHDTELFEYDKDTGFAMLEKYCSEVDFVYHLAGINRPIDELEYQEGNVDFTFILLNTLKKYNNTCPVMYSSSVHAMLDTSYGKSKKAAEELLFQYSKETGAKVYVYRFANVFGKGCKPNYNSAVATFCYNIAHDLPIKINDPRSVLLLAYIDDLVDELICDLEGKEHQAGDFCILPILYTITLEKIVDLIKSFGSSREALTVPDMSDALTKKLYSTYLSYLPEQSYRYELKMNIDNRGSFTEFMKQKSFGQISVNIIKPGVTKGNHWHNTKTEKFMVVSGSGVIQLRKFDAYEILSYSVCGEKLEVIDIPVGYSHNITNVGDIDMVVIIWVNENFDPNQPDTYYLEI